MVCRTTFALVALVLSVLPARAEEQTSSLRLSSLKAGQKFHVRTAESEYRIQLIDVESGQALVADSRDGKQFSSPEKMFIVGAARGPQPDDGGFSLVLMGELHEGMAIEWGRGSLAPEDRGTTSLVQSISLNR